MRLPIDLRLARHGVIVLLLGMLTGFMIGSFHSRNLGNASFDRVDRGLRLDHFWPPMAKALPTSFVVSPEITGLPS